jgi:hypothetical protein
MKKIILFSFLLIITYVSAFSQIEFGLRVGLNSAEYAAEGISIINLDQEEFNLFAQEANYGVHFGLYSRISLLGIFIEPAAIFNSSSVTYRVEEFDEGGLITLFKNERFNSLDIPVMAGFKFLLFRVYGGPVAHLHINSSSEVFDIPGYEQRFKEATYGWQAGIGLDIFNVRLDLNYEGNLSKFGDHITFDGQPYSFSDSPSRLIASVGVKF